MAVNRETVNKNADNQFRDVVVAYDYPRNIVFGRVII